jgi:O-antigen ligase
LDAGQISVETVGREPSLNFFRWAAPLVGALVVGLLAADQGGFFPTSWGWAAMPLLWIVGVSLLLNVRSQLGGLDLAAIVIFTAMTLWTALSILWSDAPASSVLETQRAIVYAAALAAVLLFARRRWLSELLGALLISITLVSIYGLAARLFPDVLGAFDPVSSYRLSTPVGYWNGLGILVSVGILLAVGSAARAKSVVVRVLCAAVLVLLVPTLYFTFSRGAWAALVIGFLVALAYDRRRLQLVSVTFFLLPSIAAAAWLAVRSPGLTHEHVPLARAVHDGHRLALALAALLAIAAGSMILFIALERRVRSPRRLRLAYGALLLVVPVAVVVIVFARYGGPVTVASKAYDAFTAPPTRAFTRDPNLNKRLLKLTGNGRAELWRVAWDEYVDHPVLGSGAGTYNRYWFRDRRAGFNALDAHGLYIESLAELGPIGLGLLIAALALPLLAATRIRNDPRLAVVLGAYVAFLVHTGVDWDRELPGVSLAGLLCGTVLLVAARRTEIPRPLHPAVKVGGLIGVVAFAVFAFVGLIGNSALSASHEARSAGRFQEAEHQAEKARRLMPWSPDPWAALGEAQYAQGDFRRARASFRDAIAKDAGSWTLWFDLGAVSRGAARRRALAHASALNPHSYEIADLRSRSGR